MSRREKEILGIFRRMALQQYRMAYHAPLSVCPLLVCMHSVGVDAPLLDYVPLCWSRCPFLGTSVVTSLFLQRNMKCILVEFCRSVTPFPHARVNGHLGDDSHPLLY